MRQWVSHSFTEDGVPHVVGSFACSGSVAETLTDVVQTRVRCKGQREVLRHNKSVAYRALPLMMRPGLGSAYRSPVNRTPTDG